MCLIYLSDFPVTPELYMEAPVLTYHVLGTLDAAPSEISRTPVVPTTTSSVNLPSINVKGQLRPGFKRTLPFADCHRKYLRWIILYLNLMSAVPSCKNK